MSEKESTSDSLKNGDPVPISVPGMSPRPSNMIKINHFHKTNEKKKRKANYGFMPINTLNGPLGSNSNKEKYPRLTKSFNKKSITKRDSNGKIGNFSSIKFDNGGYSNKRTSSENIRISYKGEVNEDIKQKGSCDKNNKESKEISNVKKNNKILFSKDESYYQNLKKVEPKPTKLLYISKENEIRESFRVIKITHLLFNKKYYCNKDNLIIANLSKKELIFRFNDKTITLDFMHIQEFKYFIKFKPGLFLFFLKDDNFPIVGLNCNYSGTGDLCKNFKEFCGSLQNEFTTENLKYFKLEEYFYLVKCVMEEYGIPVSDQRSLIYIMRGALSKNLTKSFNEVSSRNKSQNESGNQISNNRNVDNDQEKEANINNNTASTNPTVLKNENLQKQLINFANKPLLNGKKNEELLIYPFKGIDSVIITTEDVERLKSKYFLNDSLIEFYLKYLYDQLSDPFKDKFHLINSFFYEQILRLSKKEKTSAEIYQSIRKWNKKIDLFSKLYLIIPINQDYHWHLLVIYNPGALLGENYSNKIIKEDSDKNEHFQFQQKVQKMNSNSETSVMSSDNDSSQTTTKSTNFHSHSLSGVNSNNFSENIPSFDNKTLSSLSNFIDRNNEQFKIISDNNSNTSNTSNTSNNCNNNHHKISSLHSNSSIISILSTSSSNQSNSIEKSNIKNFEIYNEFEESGKHDTHVIQGSLNILDERKMEVQKNHLNKMNDLSIISQNIDTPIIIEEKNDVSLSNVDDEDESSIDICEDNYSNIVMQNQSTKEKDSFKLKPVNQITQNENIDNPSCALPNKSDDNKENLKSSIPSEIVILDEEDDNPPLANNAYINDSILDFADNNTDDINQVDVNDKGYKGKAVLDDLYNDNVISSPKILSNKKLKNTETSIVISSTESSPILQEYQKNESESNCKLTIISDEKTESDQNSTIKDDGVNDNDNMDSSFYNIEKDDSIFCLNETQNSNNIDEKENKKDVEVASIVSNTSSSTTNSPIIISSSFNSSVNSINKENYHGNNKSSINNDKILDMLTKEDSAQRILETTSSVHSQLRTLKSLTKTINQNVVGIDDNEEEKYDDDDEMEVENEIRSLASFPSSSETKNTIYLPTLSNLPSSQKPVNTFSILPRSPSTNESSILPSSGSTDNLPSFQRIISQSNSSYSGTTDETNQYSFSSKIGGNNENSILNENNMNENEEKNWNSSPNQSHKIKNDLPLLDQHQKEQPKNNDENNFGTNEKNTNNIQHSSSYEHHKSKILFNTPIPYDYLNKHQKGLSLQEYYNELNITYSKPNDENDVDESYLNRCYFIIFDSLVHSHQHLNVIRAIRNYLKDAALYKKKKEIVTEPDIIFAKVPLQSNYYDCGIYLLHYMEEFMKDPDMYLRLFLAGKDTKENFSSSDIPNKRGMLIDLIQRLSKEYQEKVKNEFTKVKTEDDEDIIMETVNINVKTEEKPNSSHISSVQSPSNINPVSTTSPKVQVTSSPTIAILPKTISSSNTVTSPKIKSPTKVITSLKIKSPTKIVSSPKIKPPVKSISSLKVKPSKTISSPKTVTSPKLGFRSNMMKGKSKNSSSNNKTKKKVTNHNPISIPEKKSNPQKESPTTTIKRKHVLEDSYIHTPSKNRKKNNATESTTSSSSLSEIKEAIISRISCSSSESSIIENLELVEKMVSLIGTNNKYQSEKEEIPKKN